MDMDDPIDPGLREAITGLRDTHPGRDLWPAIAQQLAPRHPRGTLLVRWPVALAAGLAIVALTSGVTALVLRRVNPADTSAGMAATAAAADTSVPTVSASFATGDAALSRAITQLERVVRADLATQDPGTRASVDTSLALLDRAIAQAAARQTAAPDDPRAARLLTSTLRKKLDVLRTVSQLTSAS